MVEYITLFDQLIKIKAWIVKKWFTKRKNYKIEEKEVNMRYIKDMDNKEELRWVAPKNIAEHLRNETYEYFHEYDDKLKIKYKLIIKASNGETELVLMQKKL